MLRASYLLAAIAAALIAPAAEALAGGADHSRGRYSLGYHRNYHRGFHVGFRDGYANGYRQGYYNGKSYVYEAPLGGFGAALLGATYGYWSDGYRVYGGDPCYRYNDRDWDWDRVC